MMAFIVIFARFYVVVLGFLPQKIIPAGLFLTILVGISILVFQLLSSRPPWLIWLLSANILIILNSEFDLTKIVPWYVYALLYITLILGFSIYYLRAFHGFAGGFYLLKQLHFLFIINVIMQFLLCAQNLFTNKNIIYTIFLLTSYVLYFFISFIIFDTTKSRKKTDFFFIIGIFAFNACFEHIIYNMFWYNLSLLALLFCITLIKNSMHKKKTTGILRLILILFLIPTPFRLFPYFSINFDRIVNILSACISVTMAFITIAYKLPLKEGFKFHFKEAYSEKEIIKTLVEKTKDETFLVMKDFKTISLYCKNNKLPYDENALYESQHTKVYFSGEWGSIILYFALFVFLLFILALGLLSDIRATIIKFSYNSTPAIASTIDTIETAYNFSFARIDYVCDGKEGILKTPQKYFTEIYSDQCNDFYREGNLKAALHKADLLVLLNKNSADYYDNRVTVYFAMGAYDRALIDIEHTLKLDPNNPIYIASKGSALVALNRPDEGVMYINRALEIRDIGFAYRFRALANMIMTPDNSDDIIRDLNYSINLNGNQNDYLALARFYLERKNYVGAYDALQSALKIHLFWGKTYYWLAIYYDLMGNYDKSNENYILAKKYGYVGNGY